MITENQRVLLYNLCILGQNNELKRPKIKSKIVEFCHTYTEQDFADIKALKENGLVDYKELKYDYKYFVVTDKGREENERFCEQRCLRRGTEAEEST